MKLKSKKGQTEDIFADLVISLILIAATIAAIKWGESSMKDSITLKQTREISSQHAIDMLSLMRMPLTEAELAGWNMYEEMTFGEIFAIMSDGNRERYPWVFSALVGNRRESSLNTCTREFEDMIAKRIKSAWQVAVYDSEGKEKMFCSSGGIRFAVEDGTKHTSSMAATGGGISEMRYYQTKHGEQSAMLNPEECAFFSQNIPAESGKAAVVEMGVCP